MIRTYEKAICPYGSKQTHSGSQQHLTELDAEGHLQWRTAEWFRQHPDVKPAKIQKLLHVDDPTIVRCHRCHSVLDEIEEPGLPLTISTQPVTGSTEIGESMMNVSGLSCITFGEAGHIMLPGSIQIEQVGRGDAVAIALEDSTPVDLGDPAAGHMASVLLSGLSAATSANLCTVSGADFSHLPPDRYDTGNSYSAPAPVELAITLRDEYATVALKFESELNDLGKVSPSWWWQLILQFCDAAEDLDLLKRKAFYAVKPDEAREAKVTRQQGDRHERYSKYLQANGSLPVQSAHIDHRMIHSFLGFMTESGEFAEKLFEASINNKPINPDDVFEELGDMRWYLNQCIDAMRKNTGQERFTMRGVENANIAKLSTRYEAKGLAGSGGERDYAAEKKAIDASGGVLRIHDSELVSWDELKAAGCAGANLQPPQDVQGFGKESGL